MNEIQRRRILLHLEITVIKSNVLNIIKAYILFLQNTSQQKVNKLTVAQFLHANTIHHHEPIGVIVTVHTLYVSILGF